MKQIYASAYPPFQSSYPSPPPFSHQCEQKVVNREDERTLGMLGWKEESE